MKIKPVKGTNDYLPNEVLLRDYVAGSILETYRACGFERISTPILEDIENLEKSDGGDNVGLIFKILKRGETLEKTLEENKLNELADMGLRYDLTLPLARYYANNRANLSFPFKCIQLDKGFRAEKPQKGRYREFIQCDIDIIGMQSYYAEIEIINATAKALQNIGMKGFIIKINDRRILKSIILSMGFKENQIDSVCITFDKLDKIQNTGVEKELLDKGFSEDAINKFMEFLSYETFTVNDAKRFCSEEKYINELNEVINSVCKLANGEYQIIYDKALVRGQGYYTGLVFEIAHPEFNTSIAGGGRYDNMIGTFLNENIPAVGFSIGFERITSILLENKFVIPNQKKKIAVMYGNETNITCAIQYADSLRAEYDITIIEKGKKLGKVLKQLEGADYYAAHILEESVTIKILNEDK